ncbi:MAG TPA: nuclear transport factor 2 family protein [Terracidiphilus sp.]
MTPARFRVYHPYTIMPDARINFSVRLCSVASLAMVLVFAANAVQPSAGMPRAQRHESRHEIDQLEQTWRDAIIHRNASAMDSLLADDYIAITSNGTLQSKEQTLTNLKAGSLHFASIEFSDRKVRFYGQTALVTSRAEVNGGTADGDVSGSYRYTRVYVRDERGTWRIVSFEASKIRGSDERK